MDQPFQDSQVIPNGVQELPSEQAFLAPQGVPKHRPPVRTIQNASFMQARFMVNDTREQTVLNEAVNRQYLMIQNRSTSSIFVVFGQKATSIDGFELAAGDSYELAACVPVDSVHIIGEQLGGQQPVIVIEGKI